MYSVTYVSSATMPFTGRQLEHLLNACVVNNVRDDITGMLLYKSGNFMQVMEGEEPVLLQTLARVQRDWRHSGMIVLLQGSQRGRQFASWPMGYRNLDEGQDKPVGYSEFVNSALTGDEFAQDPTRAQRLLLSFKQSET